MHDYRKKAIAANVKGVEFLFKKNGVHVLRGLGSLAGAGRVRSPRPTRSPTPSRRATWCWPRDP